jgi:hypothetical protein
MEVTFSWLLMGLCAAAAVAVIVGVILVFINLDRKK